MLGKSAYNFALYCGSAPASYYMLRRSFDAGAKPAAIVVDFQPELLMGDSMKILNRVYPELLTFRETAELCWTTGTSTGTIVRDRPGRPVRRVRGRQAPALGPEAVRDPGRASSPAIKGESASVKEKLLAAKRNWKINQGAEVLPKNPYYQGEVPEFGRLSRRCSGSPGRPTS